ncbi:Glycerophosphoryl diester phosphodiesterase family protein [Dyadobacter koreensis]|uniref:Glycerophosphoryl diester phosphodiesterase family protein n=1 Tax=Dyadobacter koreensis TaxID=408657 RepID=A0A1H6S807_9BACT|nr:glycerophosphodiester phosphodiesterase family protein [Dyadobacter koreensis]SEI62024.1 Glycerophosphoryl diester phosphodiesterase family protein [Dyadobacter koreensis]
MPFKIILYFAGLVLPFSFCMGQSDIKLIAHRGGIVDSTYTENGFPALKKAAEAGYQMIEIDIRKSKDGILLANHDPNFSRYYGFPGKVTETNWVEIQKLSSKTDQNTPLKLEDIFRFCQSNELDIMLDNKIDGLDVAIFNQLISLLDQYNLRKNALMIGTDESIEFFTGKIKLSCTRKQLEENKKRTDYNAGHYFLFERPANLNKGDVLWASNEKILVVAAINKYHYKNQTDLYKRAESDCKKMQEYGVKYFQIDSEFGQFF